MTIRQSLIILIIGIITGVILLLWQSSSLPSIRRDDGISYLVAMGNQEVYKNNDFVGQWVPARQWKELWSKTESFQFGRIRDGLAHTDIHPPLYFWTLHIWSYIAGVDLSTGPVLNILFHVMTAIFIFLICIRLRCPPLVATAVSLLWLLNGCIIAVAQETRQYGFLAFSSILYLYSLLSFLRQHSSVCLLFVIVTSSIGMLIHYHFALLIGVSLIYVSIHLVIVGKVDKLLKLYLSLVVSGFVFFIFHPEFYMSFARQRNQLQIFYIENLVPRTIRSIKVFINLFLPTFPTAWISKLILVIGIIGGVGLSVRLILNSTRDTIINSDIFRNYEFLPLVNVIFVTLIIWSLYVFHYSPEHAMSVKYIMLISPIYFVVIGQFISLTMSKKIMVFFFPIFLFSQFIDSSLYIFRYQKNAKNIKRDIVKTFLPGTPIIIDSKERGILPRILWHVQDTTGVYTERQSNMIIELPPISTLKSFLYISHISYGNSIEGQNILLEKFYEKGFKLYKTETVSVIGKTFLLVKGNTTSNSQI